MGHYVLTRRSWCSDCAIAVSQHAKGDFDQVTHERACDKLQGQIERMPLLPFAEDRPPGIPDGPGSWSQWVAYVREVDAAQVAGPLRASERTEIYWEALVYAFGRHDSDARLSFIHGFVCPSQVPGHEFATRAQLSGNRWSGFAELYDQMLKEKESDG